MFGGKAQSYALLVLSLSSICIFQPSAHAQTAVCGAEVVNRLELDAAPVLQKCIMAAEGEALLVPGNYYLRSTLDLGNKSNITIRTQGERQRTICLSTPNTHCAVLTASSENNSLAPLFNSIDAKKLVLDHIAIDGNIAARRAKWGNDIWNGGGYNAKIHGCTQCRFLGFASVRAVQGTGLEFDGENAIFDQVLFKENGWDALSLPDPKAMHWADGLTIWSSKDLKVINSYFINNTDIDLILGSAPQALIENNTFVNNFSYAFGALMLDNFNNHNDGNFTGTLVRKNTIHCGQGMCGIGINVGPHLWYKSEPIHGAKIYDNRIEGARQGILTNGAVGTEIYSNQITGTNPYANDACLTQPLSYSPQDEVNIHDNTVEATLSQLSRCWPQKLAETLHVPPGTDWRISQLYRDVLGRNPDIEGAASLTRSLQQGQSLKDIRRYMAASDESTRLLTVLADYYLDRELTDADRKDWQGFLANGGSVARLRVLLQLSR